MRALLNRISENPDSRLDAVLHLGAGRAHELADYLRLNSSRVVLVEPNPRLATELRMAARDAAAVEVVEAAVAATSGEAPLQVLNKSEESSLRRPTHLLRRFPNLRVVRTDVVQTTTLSQLVERLALDADGNNLLVLELQGEELSVLSSTPEKVLQKFAWIATRSSDEVLYEDGAQLADLDALLRECGFAREAPETGTMGRPFEEVLYRRDARQIGLADLRSQLLRRDQDIHSLRQSLDSQIRLVADQQAEIERLSAERDEQAHRYEEVRQSADLLQQQIVQLAKERDEQARLAAEHRARIEQLTKARDDQTSFAAERQALVETLTTERDAQTKIANGYKAELEKVSKTRDEQIRLAQARQAEIDGQTRLLHDKQARIAQLESQLAEFARRHAVLSEEMVKAEGQIDVIKYVLLREPNA